jgi:dTDP-4-amino-4,6-dideoxygalactose transaminase
MHDVPIIEDCAQAHGAFYKEQTVPISNIGCFSFYPSKNLGALGDAGMVVTNNKSLSEKLKLLRHYGQSDKYHAKISGFNSRLDELQAAILRTELPYLDFWMRERRARAAVYTTSLSDIVDTPIEKLDTAHAYHLYVIQTDQRDELKEGLNERNVGSDIHYPIPLHLQEAYSHLGYHEGDFPVAERLSQRILSLPIFPQLEDKEQMKVIESVRSALE